MKKKLLITGGSGTLGSSIIKQAIGSDCYDVSTISTNPEKRNFPAKCSVFKSNLVTGEGLTEALAGVNFVIHCASSAVDTQRVDYDGAIKLLSALDKDAIQNLIYVSIVGIDDSTYPYYMVKSRVEQLIAGSGVPYGILRTTQFHDFVLTFIKGLYAADYGIKVPKGVKFQSIAVPEVSELLIRMVTSKPGRRITSVGGPEIMDLEVMVIKYLQSAKRKLDVASVDPIQPREIIFSNGRNLISESRYGNITWTDFLEGLKY